MKTMALFVIVLGASCTTAESDTSTETADLSVNTAQIPDITTESWDPNLKDSEKLEALWDPSVTAAQLLLREGPDLYTYNSNTGVWTPHAAYLAFVVWDHTTVKHVYWIIKNSAVGVDFTQSWQNALATRTLAYNAQNPFFHWAGGNGGGGVGPQPSPHPNVANFVIHATWQQNAINAAAAFDQTETTFAAYSE
jgi:hypothetical protein